MLILLTIGGTVIGALIAQFANMRRAPAQARLDDANAENVISETASRLIADLRVEIDRKDKEHKEEIAGLTTRIAALEAHIEDTERLHVIEVKELKEQNDKFKSQIEVLGERNTQGEIRQAQSDARDERNRQTIHTLGEKLDKERSNNSETTEKLVILIERLLVCIESPDRANEVDLPGIQTMIANIRREGKR